MSGRRTDGARGRASEKAYEFVLLSLIVGKCEHDVIIPALLVLFKPINLDVCDDHSD